MTAMQDAVIRDVTVNTFRVVVRNKNTKEEHVVGRNLNENNATSVFNTMAGNVDWGTVDLVLEPE